jgi:hypothetical protein
VERDRQKFPKVIGVFRGTPFNQKSHILASKIETSRFISPIFSQFFPKSASGFLAFTPRFRHEGGHADGFPRLAPPGLAGI